MSPNDKRIIEALSLCACLLVVLLLPGLHSARAQVPDSPWKGKAVFAEKGCAQCHAVYGEGGTAGPDLGQRKFYGTYLELAAMMWNHFPGMSKRMRQEGYQFKEFDREEMSALLSYLAYIRYLGEPGNEFRGRRLLESKGCTSCHKFGGSGGDLGPDISAIEDYMSPLLLVESMWNHGPQLMRLFQEHNITRPQFEGTEMLDLAVAIRSYMSPTRVPPEAFDLGDPANGKRLAERKRCTHCHAAPGAGAGLGPDFSALDFNYSVTEIAGKMWNHGPKMWEMMQKENMAIPVFESGEMADVIAYVYGLKLQDPPGNAASGKMIVGKKNCLSCHSLQGKGGEIAGDLAAYGEFESPLEIIVAMWNHAPKMQEKLTEMKLSWPQLSGKEMAEVYAYLHALNSSSGGGGN